MSETKCVETMQQIYWLFQTENYTPDNVDLVKAEVNPHCLVCPSCRLFLEIKFQEFKVEKVKQK